MKKDHRFEYDPWKNVRFCFTSMVWLHFSHKTEKKIYFDKKRYYDGFVYVPLKNI